MAAVIGGPDWMPPMGASAQVLTIAAIDITVAHGSQQVDITAFLQPQMTAIQCFWLSGAGSASVDITLQVFIQGVVASPVGFRDTTFLPNGEFTTTPMVGALATSFPGSSVIVLAGAPIGRAVPIIGQLVIVGISSPPIIVSQVNQIYKPTMVSSGNVVCAPGVTTVLAAPPEAQYYVVRYFSWVWNAAPAANVSVTVGDAGSGLAIIAQRASGAQNESYNFPIKYTTASAISVTNGSAVNGSCRIFAELWPG